MKHERGNALFLILIAVALFAALSYAITRSGRAGGTMKKESAMVSSGNLTQYPAQLKATAERMIISGAAAANTITFDTGTPHSMFDSSGGGMENESPPTNIGNATAWIYKDVTNPARYYYVKGVGTDDSDHGSDAVAVLHDLTVDVCAQILRGLGAPSMTAPLNTAVVDWSPAGGLPVFNVAAANTVSGPGIDGNSFYCIKNDVLYDYYHVLIQQ